MFRYLILIFFGFSFYSCNTGSNTITSERKEVNQVILDAIDGESLFQLKCQSCHLPPNNGKRDAMKWRSILTAIPNSKYLRDYIASTSMLVNNTDYYTLEIKKKWNNPKYMHEFKEALGKDSIEAICLYIEKQVQLVREDMTGISIHSDSIRLHDGAIRERQDLYLYSDKKRPATGYFFDEKGQMSLWFTLKPMSENKIVTDSLKKGIYIIEIYDDDVLIFSSKYFEK